MVELDAYATDCRVLGQVELVGRLADALNGSRQIRVCGARVEDLGDGHVLEEPDLAVMAEELCAVVATGPRGEQSRRLVTRTTPVLVEIGPYRIVGMVHSPRAGDPFGDILRRGPWVALTEATVLYVKVGQVVSDRIPALLVNRALMQTFRRA